jgi:hypothetical protein
MFFKVDKYVFINNTLKIGQKFAFYFTGVVTLGKIYEITSEYAGFGGYANWTYSFIGDDNKVWNLNQSDLVDNFIPLHEWREKQIDKILM